MRGTKKPPGLSSLYSSGKRETNKQVKYINHQTDVCAKKESKAAKESVTEGAVNIKKGGLRRPEGSNDTSRYKGGDPSPFTSITGVVFALALHSLWSYFSTLLQ